MGSDLNVVNLRHSQKIYKSLKPYFIGISAFFVAFYFKKLLTKPPESAVAPRPFNQGIVRFAANLDFTLGGMSYESN